MSIEKVLRFCGPVRVPCIAYKNRCRALRRRLCAVPRRKAGNPKHSVSVAEDGQSIPLSVYNSVAARLHRGFLPRIPGRGINGLMLTGGLELFFLRWRMPYSIHWGARSGSLFENIELMLMRDIPVILAVGPNFPLFWQKNTLSFYCREPDGTLVKSCAARAHYVVVTGMDEDWLRISSWGREYYINRGEYTAYGKKHSIPILNSIAVIKPKAR